MGEQQNIIERLQEASFRLWQDSDRLGSESITDFEVRVIVAKRKTSRYLMDRSWFLQGATTLSGDQIEMIGCGHVMGGAT